MEARLRAGAHDAPVVVGVITNNSVEATLRMAFNLEFATYLVMAASPSIAEIGMARRGVPKTSMPCHLPTWTASTVLLSTQPRCSTERVRTNIYSSRPLTEPNALTFSANAEAFATCHLAHPNTRRAMRNGPVDRDGTWTWPAFARVLTEAGISSKTARCPRRERPIEPTIGWLGSL